jgi:hypothetical protein
MSEAVHIHPPTSFGCAHRAILIGFVTPVLPRIFSGRRKFLEIAALFSVRWLAVLKGKVLPSPSTSLLLQKDVFNQAGVSVEIMYPPLHRW